MLVFCQANTTYRGNEISPAFLNFSYQGPSPLKHWIIILKRSSEVRLEDDIGISDSQLHPCEDYHYRNPEYPIEAYASQFSKSPGNLM